MHRLGDDQRVNVILPDFEIEKMARDKTGNPGAGFLGRARCLTHQAQVARAIDQRISGPRQGLAGPPRGGQVPRIAPAPRAAIDANRPIFVWFFEFLGQNHRFNFEPI